jgi:hypothetical protein
VIYRNSLLLVLILAYTGVLFNCEPPLKPKKIDEDINFELIVDYGDLTRIIDKAVINLTWSEITIDNFKEIKIIRYNDFRDPGSYPFGTTENGWTTVITTTNPFVTSWTDTVYDDARFRYKVQYFDDSNNLREKEGVITLPLTTHLMFPSEVDSLPAATRSYIIDDGDSILIAPGIHNVQSFSFYEKDFMLFGTEGSDKTIIRWAPTFAYYPRVIHDDSYILMGNGSMRGLTIQSGIAEYGGGIKAFGNAVIRNCVILECSALRDGVYGFPGFGGALYLSDNALVENTIVRNDSTFYTDSGVMINAMGTGVRIRNSVFFNNHVISETQSAIIENCLFIGTLNYPYSAYPSINAGESPSVSFSAAGAVWRLIDETNITGLLDLAYVPDDFHQLVNSPGPTIPLDFHPNPGSVCIDSGNPDVAFNDRDGSRNDIGAYGGPGGVW